MTHEEIIAMANEAGLNSYRIPPSQAVEVWTRFAALVAAKEREACALVCENLFQKQRPYQVYAEAAQECADATRARGTKEGV